MTSSGSRKGLSSPFSCKNNRYIKKVVVQMCINESGSNEVCERLHDKDARNAEYLTKIQQGIAQLEAGKGQLHELIEVDEDE